LAARQATFDPYKPRLGGPFRRAKNGPSQMRSPVYTTFEEVFNEDETSACVEITLG